MSWIDDRLKQRNDAYRKSVLIEQGAERTFNDLWDAITRLVEEAQSKNVLVFTNGTPLDRTIGLSVAPRFGQTVAQPKELTIRLVKERNAIMVGGTRLELDLCEDDVVCIKRNGERVAISDLAVSILDQFLFPDLTKPES